MKFISLVGPPNAGKTTLFNYLSGKNIKTVNYPGATVDYNSATFRKQFNLEAHLVDTPGIVSLLPASIDEVVTVQGIYKNPEFGVPDLIVVTVDASQLSRHLLLVKELIEAKFSIIVALTMVDILEKKGFTVNCKKLSGELGGVPVLKVDPRNGTGVDKLVDTIKSKLNTDFNPEDIVVIDEDNKNLIRIYKEIEEIEKKVISHKNKKGSLKKSIQSLHEPDVLTLKIDKLLLSKGIGFLVFVLIMVLMFASIFWLAAPLMDLVDQFFGLLANWTVQILGKGIASDFIADGIIAGLGAVSVFIPQIIILFLILGLLEDSGYLARGAMLIDRPLARLGLNGRSFVPLLSGFACAIPAIMATRTIPNRRERFLTIFIIPLISCSARLPVYALLIAFLVPSGHALLSGAILALIYIISITLTLIAAAIINKMRNKIIRAEDKSSFILELPTYRMPKLSVVWSNTWTSTKTYIRSAGLIIVTFSIILWVLTYLPNFNPKVDATNLTPDQVEAKVQIERINGSYAAELGKIIEPVMAPMGLDWRVGVAVLTTFAAREVFVSSMALMFKITDTDDNSIQKSILKSMKNAVDKDGKPLFTTSTIIGLIIFFIIALQCISTLAISRKETGSWRLPILQFVIYSGGAYVLAVIAVNLLRSFGIN
jgi:ferrous iron transport protein B